jgi:hypothetical protein
MTSARDGSHDFDFLYGAWQVQNHRLINRLQGSDQWEDFPASSVCRPLLNGLGNEDEFLTPYWPGYIGMSLRFYNLATHQWSIYWVSNRTGVLEPPVVGSFTNGVGRFEGVDTFEEQPIKVVFTWSEVETPTPRWEQAFSADGGQTWEMNWRTDFSRA